MANPKTIKKIGLNFEPDFNYNCIVCKTLQNRTKRTYKAVIANNRL